MQIIQLSSSENYTAVIQCKLYSGHLVGVLTTYCLDSFTNLLRLITVGSTERQLTKDVRSVRRSERLWRDGTVGQQGARWTRTVKGGQRKVVDSGRGPLPAVGGHSLEWNGMVTKPTA